MRTAICLIVLIVLLCSQADLLAQGLLSSIREDVRKEEKNDDTKETRQSGKANQTSNNNCFADDDSGPDILLVFPRFTSDPSEWMSFPAYPYPMGLRGYMQHDPVPVGRITGNENDVLDLKGWAVRFSLEEGNNFAGLNRFNGTFLGETQFLGLGLYTTWNYLHERLGCGCTDDLVLGNITATFRIVESRRFLLRWGLGGWILADYFGSNSGVNLHLSADYFPSRPWVISAVVEGGSLGETGIVHTRVTGGWLWKGLELFGGYDFLQIGNSNIHTPLVGLRMWF